MAASSSSVYGFRELGTHPGSTGELDLKLAILLTGRVIWGELLSLSKLWLS